LAAEEENIENVKERSMAEGADRLAVLTLCSDLTAHSVQFVALVLVERVLPAYYASMLRDKILQQPAPQRLNGSDGPKKEKAKILLGGCEAIEFPLRLRARL
jgi:hypothetical protein